MITTFLENHLFPHFKHIELYNNRTKINREKIILLLFEDDRFIIIGDIESKSKEPMSINIFSYRV